MTDDFGDSFQRTPPPPLLTARSVWEPGLRYAVYTGNKHIGSSNLEVPVIPGARLAGRFRRTLAFSEVAWVFQLYAEALRTDHPQLLMEYVRHRDSLRLEVWDTATRLQAKVDLISEWEADHHVIHVSTRDHRVWGWRRTG